MVWIKRLFLLVIFGVVGTAMVLAFMPQPIHVDTEAVQEGPLSVAVRDDGMTRIRERYIVSTPLPGRLRRIEFDVGDSVEAGKTVLASMEPTTPQFLDPRELAGAEARVKAAEGRLRRAGTELQQARDHLKQAQVDLERYQLLSSKGATTDTQYEQAQLMFRTRTEAVKSAEFLAEIAEYELEQEKAALVHVTAESDSNAVSYEFDVVSPIDGKILRLMQESSAVLTAGSPLMELGDPTDLEVIVDVLSNDAVRILPGQKVLFEHWGGKTPLEGSVRLVEPSGFTKISALGVEEQRVNVIIDFVDPFEKRPTVGDAYRVEANIFVWESGQALSVPTGALFRQDQDWAVFVVENNRARVRTIEIGENNGLRAEVLSGLKKDEIVIVHPSDEISDGVAIEIRK